MRFDIREPKERTYKVDGKNKAFLGTVWHGEDFSFTVCPPTREQLMAIQAQHDPDWHFFQTVVVGWENILDHDGQQLVCNDVNKEMLLKYMPNFVNNVIVAIRHKQLGLKLPSDSEQEAETEKNLEASSSTIPVLGGSLANHASCSEDAS